MLPDVIQNAAGPSAGGQVHIWSASVEASAEYLPALSKILSNDEQVRASRFHFDADRNRFVAARGWLRRIIAQYVGCDPGAVQFSYGANGKPELKPRSSLRFNVSHAGDIVMYAVTSGAEVGIDVEQMGSIPEMDDIARRVYLPHEIASLLRLSGEEKKTEFYRIWTCGEAILKWSGEGLVEPERRAEITKTFTGTLVGLPSPVGYTAAIAVSGKNVQFCHYSLPNGFAPNPQSLAEHFS